MSAKSFDEAKFWERMDALKASISNVFIQESFADWLDDMCNTDWSYYDRDSRDWMECLSVYSNDEILMELEKYRSDSEVDAYNRGYLPDNAGSDIRNWAYILTDYFGV